MNYKVVESMRKVRQGVMPCSDRNLSDNSGTIAKKRSRIPHRVCIAAALLLIVIIGCGTVTSVRPIKKGESAIALSFGGPVARFSGMDIPLPYAIARYRYGLNDRVNLYGGSHLLLFAFGVVGLDGGASCLLVRQSGWIPAVNAAGGIYGYIQPGGSARAFPELELTGSYLTAGRFLTYGGIQSMYQTVKPYVVFAPLVGEEVRVAGNLSVSLETKWFAPTEPTKPRDVNYRIPIAGHGALGFVFGLNYHLGGWYE